jgi:putative ABC transport system permease protein
MRIAFNSLRQVLRDLRGQKLRTFLTVCGIVWGTVAVSLLLSFGDSFHKQMIKNSAGLGRGIVIAWPSRTSLPFEGLGRGRRIPMTVRDIDMLRHRAQNLGAISAEYAQDFKLEYGDRTLSIPVDGVEPPYGPIRNLNPAPGGRFLNPIDEERRRRSIFLGDAVAKEVFGDDEPVGRQVLLDGFPFQVIGVMMPKVQESNYYGPDENRAFIPASTFRAMTGQQYIDNFIFVADHVSRTAVAKEEVQNILAARHRFDPADTEAVRIWDTTQMAQFLNTFMLAFKLFLGIVGSLTLVVGGIGVSNIMNVVVEERTREIGVKMALGSRPGWILGQFLVETLALTLTGGAIGLAISAAVCAAFPALGAEAFVGNPSISPAVSALTAGILGLIGLVAGYFPARTAANLDPVVAMKM